MADFAEMTAEDAIVLSAAAAALQNAAEGGISRSALRGKDLALMCDPGDATGDAADSFRRAASTLGARVAQLPPSLTELSTPEQVQHTAQLLGRLYDGIECIGMSPDLVRRIGVAANVPVFEGLSSHDHPTALLAARLDPRRSIEDNRCAVMQAVLIAALA
jgi:ornithine carbamoyltransferase